MALDNANFIAELSITDPPGSDPLSQGDDQIRTIKRATQQSFPNIDKAVTITADQMNLMAIQNELNIFTVQQSFHADIVMAAAGGTGENRFIFFNSETAFRRWNVGREASAVSGDWIIQRRDTAGVVQDTPFRVLAVTGVVDFDKPPTVLGAPLWVAGEVRQFVDGAAVPGANWFYANGTNGTVDLRNRIMMGDGVAAAGTLQLPNLVAAAVASSTNSTALVESQMPSHRHRILSGNAGGLTDTILNFVSVNTVVGASRNTPGAAFIDQNSGGLKFIENTGSGSGHSHVLPARSVTENGTDRDTVRPLSAVVRFFQYVP